MHRRLCLDAHFIAFSLLLLLPSDVDLAARLQSMWRHAQMEKRLNNCTIVSTGELNLLSAVLISIRGQVPTED